MLIIIIFLGSAFLFYYCLIRPFQFWSRRRIPQYRSIFEQWLETLRLMLGLTSVPETICMQYEEFSKRRYVGLYQFFKPVLFIIEPDLIKRISIKDFEHFVDRSVFLTEEQEPLWAKNLLGLQGDQWRYMRGIVTPSFTSSKMRTMFTLINDCAQQFIGHLKTIKTHEIEMKNSFTRLANDVIASTAFGINCNSFQHPNNEFYVMGNDVTTPKGFWRSMTFTMILISPKLAQLFGFKQFPPHCAQFFRDIVRNNIALRKENNIVRPDMIQLLMEAQRNELKRPLSNDDLTAQALGFFFAGFDSMSSAMAFLVYELAVNQDVQRKLREEVDETLVNSKGEITYENVTSMKYMDMVVAETLRKWPPATYVDRTCVKPYVIEPELPGESPLYIQKNDNIVFPLMGMHRHPAYFPDPDKFEPERFSDENKPLIQPFTYIPFGFGPRACIGTRFALLEMKTAVAYLLANFEILTTEKTPTNIEIAKTQFTLTSANGLWVKLDPRLL